MTTRQALPGLLAGALGLAAGMYGFVTEQPFAGVIAGLFALAATATCVRLASRLEDEVLLRHGLADDLDAGAADDTGGDADIADQAPPGGDDGGRDTDAPAPPYRDDERNGGGGRGTDAPAPVDAGRERAGGSEENDPDRRGRRDTTPSGDEPDPEVELDVEPLIEPLVQSFALPIDESAGLADHETGLFNETFFHVVLENRIAAARRHLRPVAVVLLEVVHGLPRDVPAAVEPGGVADILMETLREADTACRLRDGQFALLLEDTPETGAIWTVERIRRQLVATTDGVTVWAGIACYPAHALTIETVLVAAEQALLAAREWRQDRIEVATASE